MEKIVNAKIDNVFLGIEDHGILTFFLHLEFESYRQSYGGYSLEGPNCWKTLKEILYIVEEDDWNKLKGKYIRVKYKTDEWNKPIYAIGNIVKDKWFTLEKD